MNPRSARVPVLATILSLLLRIAYYLQIRDNPYFATLVMDEGFHDLWAREIAAGDLTGRIPFFRAPLYPHLLGLGHALFGPQTGLFRGLQLLLGAVTPALTWGLARRLLPDRPGVAAAATFLVALDGILVYFEAELLLESLLASLGTLLGLVLLWAGEARSAARWGIVGLVLGAFAITRPNVLLFAPAAFVLSLGWAGDRFRLGRWRWRSALALTAGTCALVLPVTFLNAGIGGDRVLVASQGGLNFFLGNNEEANGWSATAPSLMRIDWWGGIEDANAIAEEAAGRDLRPSEVSDYWYSRAFAWWREHPGDGLALLAKKIVFFLSGIEFGNNRSISLFFREYAPIGSPSLLLAYAMLPLALVGALALGRSGGMRGRAIVLLAGIYALSVVLFFVTARYRVPLRPMLMVLAIEGARRLALGVRRGGWRGLLPAAATLGLAVCINVNPWAREYRPSEAQFYQSVADVHRENGDLLLSVEAQERALSLDPTYPKGNLNLGTMYMALDRVPEAIRAFERERVLDPSDGRNLASLARAHQRSGRVEDADRWYAAAEEAGLEDAPTLYNHALCLERLGRPEGADSLYHRAVAADSTFTDAWNNLGVLRARAGRIEEAIPYWEKVLRIRPEDPQALENLARARRRLPDD
jgi:tetratricopeptide (TPR) repeat protein